MQIQHLKRLLMGMLWAAFLLACTLEILIFSMVDPQTLHWMGQSLQWSNQAVHTVAFFVFWAIGGLFSALTVVLALPPAEVNAE